MSDKMDSRSNDMKAVGVTGYTLVGVSGSAPHKRGNCFSVAADDGAEYKIVNFVYENLEALQEAGLTWPIGIRALSARIAVIHDHRIPDDWYQTQFCEVCCPKALLPLPQTLRHEREIMQGVREEHGNVCVTMHFRDPECLVKPRQRSE